MRLPHNGGEAELVTNTPCESVKNCTDLVILGNTLLISQDTSYSSPGKILKLDLDNPSAGTSVFDDTFKEVLAMTKDSNYLYIADRRTGVYKMLIDGTGAPERIFATGGFGDIAVHPKSGHIIAADFSNGIYDLTENRVMVKGGGNLSIVYLKSDGYFLSYMLIGPARLLDQNFTAITHSFVDLLTETADGRVILANNTTNTIQEIDLNAEKAMLFGTPSVKDIGSHDVDLKLSSGYNQAFKIEVTGGAYTVGGSVTNLAGYLKLSLWNATAGKSETISLLTQSPEDTSFTFGRSLTTGDEYEIQLIEAPEHQTCQVRNSGNQNTGKGTIEQSNVDSVVIDCAFKSYSIGGSITGLTDTLELTANSKTYTYSANDSEWKIEDLEALGEYAVTIKSAPEGYNCTIGSTGTVASLEGHITDAHITCSPLEFPIDVTVTGLTGSLKLQLNNVGQELTIDADGDYQFNSVAYDSDYSVTVSQQPEGQTCALTNATGKVSTDNLIAVACMDNTPPPPQEFPINVTVTGLTGSLKLKVNTDGQELTISADGDHQFDNLAIDSDYSVAITQQPDSQTCALTNETGKVSANTVVGVTCMDDTPPAVERNINVTVVGLPNDGGTTTVPLRAWGPIDNRWAYEDRAFSLGTASFTNTLFDGELFDIRIFSSPAGFSCSFTAETSSPVPGYDAIDGIGIVNGDVEITITCTPTI